jgi:hypothetical protein
LQIFAKFVSQAGGILSRVLCAAVTARGHMRFMIKEKSGVNADAAPSSKRLT